MQAVRMHNITSRTACGKLHAGPLMRPVCHSVRRVANPLRRPKPITALPEEQPEPSQKLSTKVEKVIEELKKTGMTAAKAKQVLKAWTDIGVKDPDELRKLLVSRSLAPIPGLAAQALLDTIASFGGFYIASMASNSEEFPGRIGLEFVGYAFGLYYFIQILLEAGVILGLFYTSYKYGTNSASLLAAVQSMAGPVTGLGLVDQATRAVNIFKVVSALEAVADILREDFKETPNDNSLKNLGAYLTLAQAKEKLGFSPDNYNLTEKEAVNIAYAFATYDTNGNFQLEPSELRALCSKLGKDLDEAEITEAVKLLDVNNNGIIEFNEFVDWWVKKNKLTGGSKQPEASV